MKTYQFTAHCLCQNGETKAIAVITVEHNLFGSFEAFLECQRTTKGRIGFLSDMADAVDKGIGTELRVLEPISLSVRLGGVDVPIYDLS